jgi:hypothetical protein
MNETVERFKVGQRWFEPGTGIIRTITWASNTEEQDIHYMPSDIPGSTYPVTGECFRRWIDKHGYALLTPDAPETDRLTALEGRVDALAARVDALVALGVETREKGETR